MLGKTGGLRSFTVSCFHKQ